MGLNSLKEEEKEGAESRDKGQISGSTRKIHHLYHHRFHSLGEQVDEEKTIEPS